jgi:hypothetical protein
MVRVRGPSSLALLALAASFTLAACSSASGPTGPGELDGLTLSAGTLNPAFDSSITSYVATIPFGTVGVTVTPTASTAHASAISVTQDAGSSAAVASGSPSAALSVPAHGSQSAVKIAVTPPGGGTPVVYTVTLVQADDGDATLGGLVLSAGSLSPAFSSSVSSYNVTLPAGTSGFTVTPSATMADVKSITVSQDGGNAATVANGKASASLKVPAAGVQSTVVIALTAQNGYTTQGYTLTVTLAGNSDASLASLTPSAGTLTPSFASGTTSYALGVPVGTASVTLTPKANNSTVRAIVVTQDGSAPATVANNTASAALPVPAIGSTSNISIRVTAQDGSSTVTYSVALKQSASNDASLASLTISAGALSPAFAPTTAAYADAAPFGTSTVTIVPTAHSAAVHSITVSQDGGAAATIASGTTSAAFNVPAVGASSSLTVVVTAQDGTTKQTYTIALTQQSNGDAKLSSLGVSAGSLSPAFTSGNSTYTVAVPFGTTTFTVTPTAHAALIQSITVAQDGGTPQTVASGSASAALSVPAPGTPSVIAIQVTAQDGTTVSTYSVSLTQIAPDNNSLLASLTPSAGSLSPGFVSTTSTYGLSVPFGTSTVTLTPDASALDIRSITVAQDSGTPQPVLSGQPSQPLTVPALGSSSSIAVTVTAQDGSQTTYLITLTQANRNDSKLSALVDSSGQLQGFSPTTLNYSYTVPFQAGTYTVTATANDALATITVNGAAATSGVPVPVTLTVGSDTTVTIEVTSADGTSVTTYALDITESNALSNIAVSVNSTPVVSNGTAVDFGTALTTANSSITFTIANSGAAPMAISSATVTSGATDFSITTAPTSPVAAAGSTTMVVKFTPTVSGTRTGAITIDNSSANQPSFVVNLTGTGQDVVASIAVTAAGGNAVLSAVGNHLQLTATASPSDATQSVTWSSGTTSVATVDANGLVTATGFGAAVITATATDGSNVKGTLGIAVSPNYVWFVSQPSGTNAAPLNSGSFAVTSTTTPANGNAFKLGTAGVYYGTNANGFLALPMLLTGDFTMTATIQVTQANIVNGASGIGIGLTTGFLSTDRYAYYVLTTSTGGANNTAQLRNVKAASVGSSGTAAGTYNIGPSGTVATIVFRRIGNQAFFGLSSNVGQAGVSNFVDGTVAYGAGPVYPAISFANVNATVTNYVIKDGAGNTLFDSATGTTQSFTPPSLSVTPQSVTIIKGNTADITVSAIAPGGASTTPNISSSNPLAATATLSGTTMTITGVGAGTSTITVTNPTDSNSQTNTKTVAVNVEDFNTSDGAYGQIAPGLLYPAPGSTGAYTDGEYAITFDGPPTINPLGTLDLYALDGTLVDRISFANDSQTVSGVTVGVGAQLARKSGNTVFFTPHFGKLAYSTSYYVAIPTTAITGATFNGGVTFTGFSNLSTQKTWSFTTRAAPALSPSTPISVDGAQASTANFRTLGGALMAIAGNTAFTGVTSPTTVNVHVAAGTYTELVNYRATSNQNLTIDIAGPTSTGRGSDTVIQYANGGGTPYFNGQVARASFYFAGANLVLENLTLQNIGTPRSQVLQAEAMYFDSRGNFTVAANNCSFKSLQDTIQTSGRAWFYNSYIEGNTDFIWGISDVALFENDDLRVVNDQANQTYSIFVARTGTTGASIIGKGYVLLGSRVSVDGGIFASYGRDAGTGSFYDQVALVNNTFSGSGQLASGLWVTSTQPLNIGDSTFVGWKASGNTGLGADTMTTATNTASTIANVDTEYDTRNHILNRVVSNTGGVLGYQDAATIWDISGLVTQFGAH